MKAGRIRLGTERLYGYSAIDWVDILVPNEAVRLRAILIGAGKLGYSVARFLAKGYDVSVIEKLPQRANILEETNIHPRAVAHNLGILQMILAVTMLVPIPWSLLDQDSSWKALVVSSAISAGFGGVLTLWGKRPEQLRRRDTLLRVSQAWVAAAAAGALPYLFSGSMTSFTDAFFESMSSFTTTGSSVLTDIEIVPGAILLWRSMTQWLGGMGIMVLVVADLSALGVGGLHAVRAEIDHRRFQHQEC